GEGWGGGGGGGGGRWGGRPGPQAPAALLGALARGTLFLDGAAELARLRRMVEAENLDWIARARLLYPLAAVVVERAHATVRVAGDDGVADLERAAVDEHRRDRPAADRETRLHSPPPPPPLPGP